MAPQPPPLNRQPECHVCGPHEQHVLPCDWCMCADPPVPGYYPDSESAEV